MDEDITAPFYEGPAAPVRRRETVTIASAILAGAIVGSIAILVWWI